MKIYNTYAEAKAENPYSKIVTTGPKWGGEASFVGKFSALVTPDDYVFEACHKISDNAWIICNPEDYKEKQPEWSDEELEAAYDLFLTFYQGINVSFEEFSLSYDFEDWIRLVRKTNYTPSDTMNG